MARRPNQSSRFQISNPQPVPELNFLSAGGLGEGPYPHPSAPASNLARPAWPAGGEATRSHVNENLSQRLNGGGPAGGIPIGGVVGGAAQGRRPSAGQSPNQSTSALPPVVHARSASRQSVGMSAAAGFSPPRPQRSLRRGRDSEDMNGAPPPSSSLRSVPSTHVTRPSNGQRLEIPPPRLDIPPVHDSPVELAIPPVDYSPVSPVDGRPTGGWAADRADRAVARQQSDEVAQQVATVRAGGENAALRNVVNAFRTAGKGTQQQQPQQQRRPRRGTVTRPSENNWDDLTSGVGGGKFAEIDGVMRRIRKDWPFIMEGDFSSSSLALSLLSQAPSRSLPPHPDLEDFEAVHSALSISLQTAVQSHFQTFAASLPTHANFVAALERAQAQVKVSRAALKDAQEGISNKGKAELASVRTRERMVREMLQILDHIDELKKVPEQLESLLRDKRFLQAALLLVRSIKLINHEDIRDIGAMSELRLFFNSQETSLTDVLVEELHNHIYLKTFNSETRWRSYVPGQTKLPVIDWGEDAPIRRDASGSVETSSRFSSYISHLAVKPNHEPILNEIAARSGRSASQLANTASITSLTSIGTTTDAVTGEVDSFAYMETLLEALAALGKLGTALDALVSRVPTEIHALIDATNDEVEERAEQRAEELSALRPQSLLLGEKQDLEGMPLFDNDTLRVSVSVDEGGPPKHAVILRDLFWTLYSKLSATMEAHRAVYEAARWIASRRDFRDTSKADLNLNVPVLEIWRPVQHEVRQLLQIYLKDDSAGSKSLANAIPSVNEVLRGGKSRDRTRDLFRFADTDARAVNNEIKEVDEGLKQSLRASVPGLINLQSGDNVNVLSGGSASDDRVSAAGGYRTLTPANPFNVTILFQPTLAFINRATAIVPPGFEDDMSRFGTVLEEFVVNVFLPQLDEKVTASFQQAVSGYDAFQLDRRPSLGDKPPLKSSVRVMTLVQSLCSMLQQTPFHKESYSRLIVGVVVQYYQQCSTRFKELATLPPSRNSSGPTLALPAVWAQREDVIAAMTLVRGVAPEDRAEVENAEQREVALEMGLLDNKMPRETQLINSTRRFESIGHLAQTMRWFMDSLLDIQELVDDKTAETATMSDGTTGAAPRLPLTHAMAQRFGAIVQTYQQLIDMTLNTMRLEVRGRVLCNLSASLQQGDFRLESEALEPDPDVTDLNTSLMEADEIVSRALSPADKEFIFRGLAALIDHVYVHAARDIKVVNSAGVRKIRRNILSLQQTLRGIIASEPEGMLLRATEYWDLFEKGPTKTLKSIRQTDPLFSFDDYNAMLTLQCKTDADETLPDLNEYLIDLHALAMSIPGWDVGA
ncbi:exocyst subunit [Vanrija albida]|uniref:Exocyst complex component Sec8 n=1 Tax=Vanrija albida TaxID=181172 RepID=A0ABR3Q666_9TREE